MNLMQQVFGKAKSEPPQSQPVQPPVSQSPQPMAQPVVTPSMSSKAQALAYGAGKPPLGGQPQKVNAPKPKPEQGTGGATKADGWGKTS